MAKKFMGDFSHRAPYFYTSAIVKYFYVETEIKVFSTNIKLYFTIKNEAKR